MKELIKLVSQKTGLDEGKAKMTLEVIIGYFKEKLPAPVFSQIENTLGEGFAGKVGEFAKGVGSALGKK